MNRISSIKNKIFVDVGFLANLNVENIEEIEEILKAGAIGFKIYMAPCVDYNIKPMNKLSLKSLKKKLKELEKTKIVLAFHSEMANARDMYISSPLRTFSKEKRKDLNFKLKFLFIFNY